MPYLTRQRFVSHKLALEGVPDYNEKGNFSIDHPVPLTWDECVVNLLTIDMILENKNFN